MTLEMSPPDLLKMISPIFFKLLHGILEREAKALISTFFFKTQHLKQCNMPWIPVWNSCQIFVLKPVVRFEHKF